MNTKLADVMPPDPLNEAIDQRLVAMLDQRLFGDTLPAIVAGVADGIRDSQEQTLKAVAGQVQSHRLAQSKLLRSMVTQEVTRQLADMNAKLMDLINELHKPRERTVTFADGKTATVKG